MVRVFTFAVGLLLLARPVAADDLIAPDTVAAIKKATVYVRVEGDGWVASGSGFVVAADAKVVLFATNHHVAVPKPKAPPRPGAKPPTITVVLDSGTRTERSIRAEIVADDSETDLTILRITSLKDAPKPIAHADAAKLVETMPVYSFGFPFGTALSTGKGFPAVTVGKASISSLRNGDNGELAVVQIDGNLNPGNSGGPVVDAKGRLVGVAVATIRDGQGIGLTIPAAELSKILRGRIGHVRIIRGKAGNGPLKVRIEADLIDPSGNLRSPTARYFVVGAKAKRPDPPLEKLSGSKTIELNVERGIASAEFMVDKGEGEVLVQVSASAGAGKPLVASRVSAYSLAPTPTGADFVGPPPTGWKEYSPRDKTFVMWVPDRPTKQAEAQRNTTIGGRRMRVNSVVGRTASGLVYEAESLLLPATVAKVARKELHDLIRSAIVSERRGRVTDSKDVQSGSLHGVEYVIESGSAVTRARVFVVGTRIYTVLVTGSAAQVAGAEGETLLSSYRHPTASVIAKGPTQVPAGNELTIQGGRLDPGFKDVSSDGALLVGLDVVVGKPIRDELIQSVRPIYRVGGKESFGAWFGTDTKNAVTIKAKTGYAIGAISAKARNVCDGFSVTFMRVVGNKLDPKDSYESDWIGWNGNWRVTKVGGDGTPAVGIAVKVGVVPRGNEKDVTGFGLLFKGQEAFNPNAVRPNVVHRGKDPTILGGVFDPEFKEIAPPGGVLIGFEIGQARAFNRDMIRSIRPIYRTGDKESSGVQRGTQLSNVSTVKAKAGYAVGAITVKHGLGFDGMSVTFMKLSGGKLDPTDTYESDWFGTDERKIPSKLGGDGTLVIGIVGKTNAKDMTGMGLLFKGQEAYEPKKK